MCLYTKPKAEAEFAKGRSKTVTVYKLLDRSFTFGDTGWITPFKNIPVDINKPFSAKRTSNRKTFGIRQAMIGRGIHVYLDLQDAKSYAKNKGWKVFECKANRDDVIGVGEFAGRSSAVFKTITFVKRVL